MLIEIDALPSGQVILNPDKITYVVKTDDGITRIFFDGPGCVDVPHSFAELQSQIANAMAGRAIDDDGGEHVSGF